MKKIFLLGCILLFNSYWLRAQSVFWEIESPEGKVSHLLGTYHLLGAKFLEAHPKMQVAYEESDAVIVETIMDSTQLMKVAMSGFDPTVSLQKLSDSAEYALIKGVMEPLLGIPLSAADQIFPLNLSVTYSVQLAAKCMPEELRHDGAPIDIFLGWKAAKDNKQVVGLESLQEQMNILFRSQTPEEQMRDLLSLLSDTSAARRTTKQLVEAYAFGDLETMYNLSMEMEESMGDMNAWLDDRNIAWMPQLKPLLNEGGCFIAVGALHLPGENGLLRLLKEAGYTMRPIE